MLRCLYATEQGTVLHHDSVKKVMISRRAQKQTTLKTNNFISNAAISTITAGRQFPASVSHSNKQHQIPHLIKVHVICLIDYQ